MAKIDVRRLMKHERDLLSSGALSNVTHEGSSSAWLEAPASAPREGRSLVYRPMGDAEVCHLVQTGFLPETQPYQTIVAGQEGLEYAMKYLSGRKKVDTSPTTIVEFEAPKDLIDHLFAMQSKPEDGVLSHGLGNNGGRGLPLFNASLAAKNTSWRIVRVKRPLRR